ncbi:MAG: MBG domain-containing protein [Planctomycetota bacterium]|nr:MBG domain-containing protein [Planctomycetota bacterium]
MITIAFAADSILGAVSNSITVTPAALTVTADVKSKVYGAALPALTYTYTGLVNGDTSATFTGALATTATGSSGVGAYAITQGTLAATGNYTIGTFNSANLTVTPAALTVTADAKSKVYGAALPALTYTYTGLVNGDTSATFTGALATTATGSSGVGTYAVTQGTLTATGNYSIGTFNGANLTVTPAALTITADDKSKIYGAAIPALTASYSGFVNGDTAASLTTPPTVSTTATVGSGVGTYPITANGAVNANYTISYVDGTLTVGQATLTVTADAKSKVYGAAMPALTYAISGYQNGDNSSVITGTPSLGTTASTSSSVGSYPISVNVNGMSAANYTFTGVAATLSVTPAALTILADNQSKVYGTANPALTYTYTGLVNGDTSATFTGALATTATGSSGVGAYAITQGTLAATGNYTIGAFNSANLTVTPAALTVTANAKSKVYGTANPALTYTYTGLVNGDTSATFTGGLATTATGSSGVGAYPITQDTLTVTGNYTIGTFNAAYLTVKPATLIITADDKSKVYGTASPALTYTYTGLVNGDTSATFTGALATTATGSSGVGTYAVTQGTLAATGNYTIGTFNSANLTVTPAALTVTADNKSRPFNAPNPALTYMVTGYRNGDTSSVVAGSPMLSTIAVQSSPVGDYSIAVDTSGMNATNYTFAGKPGMLSITKALPVITWADPADIAYGTALSSTQLNALANVAGTFAYRPLAGIVLAVGDGQTLSVSFAPDDTANYMSAAATATINVKSAVAPLITSVLTASAIQDSAFSYTITASGSTPMTFEAGNLPSGLSFSGDTISGTPTVGGVVSIALKATNVAASDTKTLQLTIAKPSGTPDNAPTVSSPPAASSNTGSTGQAVTFTAAATDSDGDILGYTWNFGDGTTGMGASASHVYTTPGIYTVTVTVSDGTTTTQQQMDYVVSAGEAPVGDDNGGDDTWDTSGLDAFSITKGALKFNFASGSKDALQLSGTIPVAKFFKPASKKVMVLIGGLKKEFTLNAKGQGTAGACKFQMKGKMKKGVFKATPAKFTLSIKGEPLLAALQEYGFANKTTAKAGEQVDMSTIIMLDTLGYEANKTVLYKATAGKSGSGK